MCHCLHARLTADKCSSSTEILISVEFIICGFEGCAYNMTHFALTHGRRGLASRGQVLGSGGATFSIYFLNLVTHDSSSWLRRRRRKFYYFGH